MKKMAILFEVVKMPVFFWKGNQESIIVEDEERKGCAKDIWHTKEEKIQGQHVIRQRGVSGCVDAKDGK